MAINGAIVGDIMGSAYEFRRSRKYTGGEIMVPRSRFTDDTVMSIAIKYALIHKISFDSAMRKLGNQYSEVGYGGMFKKWLQDENMGPYESYQDMHHASMIDWYESNTDKEYVPYVVPQEHGNHIKTKVLEIKKGISFTADTEMDINYSNYNSDITIFIKNKPS